MSSSGLIYAVIVGAWAAYLVPMWLRRQDELNEARPTERFSTAIRLLSGRAAMERRYAKELRERTAEEAGPEVDPDRETDRMESVDVRAFAAPPAHTEARLGDPAHAPERTPGHQASDRAAHDRRPAPQPPDRRHPDRPAHERRSGERPAEKVPPARRRPRSGAADAERARRAQRSQVLARRRRTTIVLFLAFTLGAIVAAVGGLGFLWAPAVPAVLLSTYIVHLRAQERRRFAFTMDRRRAEDAAQRLRENRPRRNQPAASDPAEPDDDSEPHRAEPEPTPTVSPQEAGRRALVEQTDHAEWVDQQRERGRAQGDSWEPVPVPLPTYVTAPVAPRATGGVEVGDPETWSAARSSTAEPTQTGTSHPTAPAVDPAPRQRTNQSRRNRDRGRTPLFDQYDDEGRPRAANE
ncbi:MULTISPECIES: gephyrin-like molybdotransferase receptor GlpR [unclassified Streptomyces]|uniref:divisome protein SepX/GlpR n=1 Tax=unclassified Streptomyces TaxID=2593676 RepID=UPI0009342A24|nr:gephyrin-like molybdotransferase receptor GlpR [Streptomyces sp. NBRC 110465]